MTVRRRSVLALVVLALAGAAGGAQTWAAFSATSANVGNSSAAGTVALADNDSGTAMLSLSAARPGDSDSACVTVS